ncbi:MAG TPA: hypothetical protein VF339_06240 [Gammaproteobacteria bacterium]
MTAGAEILAQLEAAGISLRVDGDRLYARPRSRLTPELAELIRAHRDELIRTLRPPRAVVDFRRPGAAGWAVCIGEPGVPADVVANELRRRFGGELEVRPREVGR